MGIKSQGIKSESVALNSDAIKMLINEAPKGIIEEEGVKIVMH